MKIITRMIDGVTIVHINGRIELGEGSAAVRDVIRDLLSQRAEEDSAESGRC